MISAVNSTINTFDKILLIEDICFTVYAVGSKKNRLFPCFGTRLLQTSAKQV